MVARRVTTSSGLDIDSGILSWSFTPSIGMVAKRFDRLGLDIRSFKEPFKRAIQQVIAPSFGQNFEAGGRPDPWQSLADDTIKLKQAAGQDNGILIRSGLLRQTIQQLNIWTITSTSAAIKGLPEKIGYGAVQQAGTGSFGALRRKAQSNDPDLGITDILKGLPGLGASAAKVAIPARPFVMLQEQDYPKIDQVFSDWLNERIIAQLGL